MVSTDLYFSFQIRLHEITEVILNGGRGWWVEETPRSLPLSIYTFIYFILQVLVYTLGLKKEFTYLFLNLKTLALQHADQKIHSKDQAGEMFSSRLGTSRSPLPGAYLKEIINKKLWLQRF